MSFALVSHYLPWTGHSAKKKGGKKQTNKKKSTQGDGGLFVQAEGNKSGKFPSRDALRGKKMKIKKQDKISHVSSAPWDALNSMLKAPC